MANDYWDIDRSIVDHLCLIAKLDLSEGERDVYTGQIKDILEAFKRLGEVDTDGIEPAYHSTKVENIWREDAVKKVEWSSLGNSLHKEDGYFKGPRII